MFRWFAAGVHGDHLEEIIARCVAIKAGFVAQDEHDKGLRQLLNLGHTVGHAIERLSDYKVSHGQAVSMGMVYAARLSERLGLCGEGCRREIQKALEKCGLPVASPYAPEELLNVILSDKKRAGDSLSFVLPKGIGECVLYPVQVAELQSLLSFAAE
jgi:3-dehydroquinate synthase